MFAAHSVAASSAQRGRGNGVYETADGDTVLFLSRIFLLSSNAGDTGQWVPQTLAVTGKALRISNSLEGCLGLPKFDFPLQNIRYAGVEFAHMTRIFGKEAFFEPFASFMKTWLKFAEAAPGGSGLNSPTATPTAAAAASRAQDKPAGDDSTGPGARNSVDAHNSNSSEKPAGTSGGVREDVTAAERGGDEVDDDVTDDGGQAAPEARDSAPPKTHNEEGHGTDAVAPATIATDQQVGATGAGSGTSAAESFEEESSLLAQDEELSSLLGLRSLYFVDQHGMCLCCTFSDDDSKEACRAILWSELQRILGKSKKAAPVTVGANDSYVLSAGSRGCKFSPSCVFTPVTTSGFCNAHRSTLTNTAKAEQNNWVIDDFFSRCQYCQKTFDILLRRHHCRLCGSLVCSDCSQYRGVIKSLKKRGSQRLCKTCVLGSTPQDQSVEPRAKDALWMFTTASTPGSPRDLSFPTMSRSNSARSVGSQGRPARGSSGDSGRAVSENQESLGALPQSDTINAAAAGASSAQASPRTGAEEKVHANSSSSGDSAGADGGAGSDDETDDEDGIDDGYTSEASESADGSAASGGELEEDGRVAVGAAPVRQRGGSEFVILEQPLEPFRDMPAPLANAIFSTTIKMPVIELKKLFYSRASLFPLECYSKISKYFDVRVTRDWPVGDACPSNHWINGGTCSNSSNVELLRRDIEYVIPKSMLTGETAGKEEQSVELDVYNGFVAVSHVQTPGVPQGNKFRVKLQVVIGAIDNDSSLMRLTQEIEWSSWSMLKNIINSKAREGITSAWKSKIEAAHRAASEYNAKREATLKNSSVPKIVAPAAADKALKKRRKAKGKKSKKGAQGKSTPRGVTAAVGVDAQGTSAAGETKQSAESSVATSGQSNPATRSSSAMTAATVGEHPALAGGVPSGRAPPPAGMLSVTVRSGANLVHLEMSRLQAFAVVFAVVFVFRRADDFVVAFGLRLFGWLLGWPNGAPQ